MCEVWSHQFGFELRMMVGRELLQSEVCRTQEDLIEVQELLARGTRSEGLVKISTRAKPPGAVARFAIEPRAIPRA